MQTILLNDTTTLRRPSVATIGFFDGVHRGHQYLIEYVIAEALKAGIDSTVITFDRHPREVLHSDYTPPLLTTTEQKLSLLADTGIETTVILPFTPPLAALSARQFMQQILHDRLNVQQLVIGYDNRFGHNRDEGFDHYVRYGRQLGIEVVRNEAFGIDKAHPYISSSVIRQLLQQGDIEQANRYLGRPYMLQAPVVSGFKEGRKLGFPTANLDISRLRQLIPATGVYAVKAQVEESDTWYRAMTSIGTRPTYNGTQLSVETNILDGFDRDIYGKRLSVAFFKRLRNEKRFDSIAQLRRQIIQDTVNIHHYFEKEETK